jgi:hydrogenase nickel incorporation protein HypA/HybF
MHELSIAQRIVDLLVRTSAEHGDAPVTSARLIVGQLAGVEVDSLRFGFEVCIRGTPAEGCRLDVVAVPLSLKCRQCGTVHGGELLEPCPACGALGAEVLEGRELRVESVELEEPGR